MKKSFIYIGCILFLIYSEGYNAFAQETNTETVRVSAEIIPTNEHSVYYIIISVDIDDGCLVFSNVPDYLSLQPFQIRMKLPEGCEKIGELEISSNQQNFQEEGLAVYKGLSVFVQPVKNNTMQKPQNIELDVIYQAISLNNILPVKIEKILLGI